MKKNQKISFSPIALIVWPVVFITQLLVAALLSWQLLAQTDFAFPWAYEALEIDQHISKFGPKNRYRPDYETTSKEDHLAQFSAIGEAIQNHGEGLEEITYTTDQGKTFSLLRKAEVLHLQDVANLVDVFYLTGYIALLLLIISSGIAIKQQLAFPKVKYIAAGILLFVTTVGLSLLVIGPKKVFYWLHVQIFPPDHEWFFYYQDSLMTTLMKAPDVFGFIGAILGAMLLVFWIVEIVALKVVLNKKIPAN